MSVVTPSWAVTTVVMTLEPTLKAMGPEAVPLVTVVPFTLTVAEPWLTVGVTVILVTPFPTVSVYVTVPEEKLGLRLPELMERLDRVASLLKEAQGEPVGVKV